METITKQELRDMLLNARRGANIVSIETETTPRMRKTDNPYAGRLVKQSKINGMINWYYENAVNNQREREGKNADFEAKPRRWGSRIHGTPLVEHKGKYYLELKVENRYGKTYIDDQGNEVPQEEIDEFLYNSSSSRQGVEDEVILRDYKLDSIKAIKMNGKKYKVAS